MKTFAELSEREVLAVAISSEEEDSRIYMTFAEDLRERYPDSAKIFEEMAEEERGHRYRLVEMYEQRFGQHLPPIRREDVKSNTTCTRMIGCHLVDGGGHWVQQEQPAEVSRRLLDFLQEAGGSAR